MKRKIFILTWICTFVLAGQVSAVYLPVSAKEKPVERVCETWDQDWVERREFGLVAKNVTDVKIGTEGRSYWEVFLKQKGDNRVKEVDLFQKKKSQAANYKMNVVIKKAKYYFPMIDRCLYVDEKKRLLLTGKDECYLNLSSGHTTEKECEKSYHEHYNKVIRSKVNGNRCWYDKGMFAYVKNNRLYITGEIINDSYEMCCGGSKERSFFHGKADKIKKVICGACFGWKQSNIFVLMKDGSLWGMGDNESNLISGSKKKYYNKFVKVISGGVKKVSAGFENVVIIKKNNTMYAWGKTWKSKKEHYFFNPQKIDSGVKEISLTDTLEEGPILVYLKRNGTAYGMGVNEGYAFTDKYKKGWHSKPVKLMGNIKHVYSASSLTLLLSKKGDLYWTGTQDAYPDFGWMSKMK